MINGRKRPFFLYWKNVISDIYNNNIVKYIAFVHFMVELRKL